MLALSAALVCEPLSAVLPDHPPEAAQEVACVLAQVITAVLPLVMVLGLTERAIVGAGVAGVTVTVADWVALPPAPVQVST